MVSIAELVHSNQGAYVMQLEVRASLGTYGLILQKHR